MYFSGKTVQALSPGASSKEKLYRPYLLMHFSRKTVQALSSGASFKQKLYRPYLLMILLRKNCTGLNLGLMSSIRCIFSRKTVQALSPVIRKKSKGGTLADTKKC